MLAKPGTLAFVKRDDRVGRALDATVEGRLGIANGNRRPVRVSLEPEEATRCFERQIGRRSVRFGTVLAKRRDGDIDQPGIERGDAS